MAPFKDRQVEKLVDDALKHNNFQALEHFLQNESKQDSSFQCSRQFITKLDKLLVRELDVGHVFNACLVLSVLHKCSDMLVFVGGGGISVMISQGLVTKWFEKAREIWAEAGSSRNEPLIKLAEDFFDALMVVHKSCKEGVFEVTNSLLCRIGKVASDPEINVMIQKEASRKMNLILEKIPTELKKKIFSSQEASTMMSDLARRIFQGGDYDLQVSLMEALCRMTSAAQRNEQAESWFNMTFVSSAFKKIKESEFETDCRRFLNMVNGMQGDGRKGVYSYPCLEAFLDKHELLMPVDENLEAFWIDFNLGSQSISFYFSVPNKDAQDSQWDTLCISDDEVQSYTVEEENGKKVLNLILTDSVSIGSLEGSRVTIKFSSSLDILKATEKVYGQAKNRKFFRKTPSVVKTPVQVSLCSLQNSQVTVLESQVLDERESSSVKAGCPGLSITHLTPDENKFSQMVTPVKMKVSESCMYITGSVGRKQGSCSSSCVLPTLSFSKLKPALQMMSSSERKKEFQLRDLMMSRTSSSISPLNIHCDNKQRQTINTTPAVQNGNKQQSNRGKTKEEKHPKKITEEVLERKQADQPHIQEIIDSNIIPDSQPAVSKRKFSVSGSLFALPEDGSGRRSISNGSSVPPPQRLSPDQHALRTLTQKQLHSQLTQRLDEVLRDQQGPDGHAKHRSSSMDPCAAGQGKEKVKTSVRSTPARPVPPNSRAQHKASYSDKQNRGHTADSMVKMISSHYKKTSKAASLVPGAKFNIATTNRYPLKKSCPSSSSTEKTAARRSSAIKTLEQSKSIKDLDDVYAFKEDTSKNNANKSGISETSPVNSSAVRNLPACTKSVLRPQPPKAVSKNAKKNLFSDTDTENMTDISWLNSANRKPKPKVADYSRQPVKPSIPPANSSFKSPTTPSPKPVKKQVKPKPKRQRKMTEPKEDKRQINISSTSRGRLQRTATMTKTYKEQSDSDSQSSQSENEKPPPTKKKALGQPEKTFSAQTLGRGQKNNTSSLEIPKRQRKIRERKECNKTSVRIQTNNSSRKDESPGHLTVMKTPSAQNSVRGHKESWMARLSSTFVSPPSIERMRTDEKLTTKMRFKTTPLRSLSISPIELDSPPPAPLSPFRDIQAFSLCETLGIKPPSVSTTTPVSISTRDSQQKPPAPMQVESSPLHSTLSQNQPPIISADQQEEQRDEGNRTSPAFFDKRSIISVTSHSSHISVSNTALNCTELEKTPTYRKRSQDKMAEFKSGPSVIYKPPSSCHSATQDKDSEEDKENRPPSPSQLAMKMKPRKLFKSNNKHGLQKKGPRQPVKNQSSSEEEVEEMVTDNGRRKKSYMRRPNKRARETLTSSNDRLEGKRVGKTEDVETVSSHIKSRCVETMMEEESDLTQPAQEVGFICHQFSSELKRKIKNRSRRMDLYTRQSLKTFQEHMFSIRDQAHRYSSQKLEKVKQVLLGEIKNLEQDDIVLRDMEEDLKTYWKKQTLAFHTYQEKGVGRLQRLKSTIQTNVCENLQGEEQIISSEMSSMKKNLNAVQERFFKEMHEEELLSVRRGLQTLFLQDTSRF